MSHSEARARAFRVWTAGRDSPAPVVPAGRYNPDEVSRIGRGNRDETDSPRAEHGFRRRGPGPTGRRRRRRGRRRPGGRRRGGSPPAGPRGPARWPRRAAPGAVWEAIAERRTRAVPSGTAGGGTASAKTPRSRAWSTIRQARSASPTTSGTTWAAAPLTSKPSRARPSRSASALARSLSTRRGCSSSRSSAAIAAAAATGGSAVEYSSVRAECTRKRAVTWSQATKPP